MLLRDEAAVAIRSRMPVVGGQVLVVELWTARREGHGQFEYGTSWLAGQPAIDHRHPIADRHWLSIGCWPDQRFDHHQSYQQRDANQRPPARPRILLGFLPSRSRPLCPMVPALNGSHPVPRQHRQRQHHQRIKPNRGTQRFEARNDGIQPGVGQCSIESRQLARCQVEPGAQ